MVFLVLLVFQLNLKVLIHFKCKKGDSKRILFEMCNDYCVSCSVSGSDSVSSSES